MIKRILPALLLCTAYTASASNIADEIAPYVYPANKIERPVMTFMPDGESYLVASDDNTRIVRYDTRTGKEIDTVFDATHTREASIRSFDGFEVSADGSKLLLYTSTEMIYRRSFRAAYYVFEIKRNILRPISTEHPLQQSPLISPDGRSIAFVADNNIYIYKTDYKSETAVTRDGEPGKIINGVPDWTYEEEFSTSCSMAWSPDSETLCFVRYDETDVPSYSLTLYEGSCSPKEQYALYPGQFTYKYPVAGEPNSRVSLVSYDLSTRKLKEISLSDSKIEYIPSIVYTSDPSELLALTLNRDQNRLEIYSVNPKSTVAKSLIVEQSKTWIDPVAYENLVVTPSSIILNSGRTGYNHLYEYTYAGALKRTITSGDYNVTQCYGADAKGNIFYQSTRTGAINRIVSRVDIKGRVADLTAESGTGDATFASTMAYAVISESDASTPTIFTLADASGKSLRTLVDNRDRFASLGNLPAREFITIPSSDVTLNAYILRPEGFNPSKRYPALVWLYNGPGSQEVLNRWSLDWMQYAARHGYVVVCADGRGTGGRDRAFQDVVYRNLGYYETIDQTNVARWLASQPGIDGSRIGVCGWSYGGYETLMCAQALDTPFAAAVAIAPVTDWRYYDTVYTERYMLTPQINEDGYNSSAPIKHIPSAGIPPLMLMYGTADDNVHPANTVEYVSALQAKGIFCDMLIFPNMNHSIYGCNSRAMVYGNMLRFFDRNLK